MISIDVLLGVLSLSGVILGAIISSTTNKYINSNDKTLETMKIQKELIDSLFDKNKILSERLDLLEKSIIEERDLFNKELSETRKSYDKLRNLVEEAIMLLKNNQVHDAIELLED